MEAAAAESSPPAAETVSTDAEIVSDAPVSPALESDSIPVETLSDTPAHEAVEPSAPRRSRRRKLSQQAQALADALPTEALSESAGGEGPDETVPAAATADPDSPPSDGQAGTSEDAESEPQALSACVDPGESTVPEFVAQEAAEASPEAESAADGAELKLVGATDDEGDLEGEPVTAAATDGLADGIQFVDPSAPEITTAQVIEAVFFVSETPLTLPKIVSVLGIGSARDVKKHIESLNEKYAAQGATFRIEKIAGGYQMLTLPQYNTWLRRLRQSKQDSRFSAAALETLAVVAYKQPVTRVDVEAIRGVAAGEMLNRLRELNLVKIVGRAEDVGRPMLYGTTKRFLEVFGLASLEELPQVEHLQVAQ